MSIPMMLKGQTRHEHTPISRLFHCSWTPNSKIIFVPPLIRTYYKLNFKTYWF